jgi:hypothetical protein
MEEVDWAEGIDYKAVRLVREYVFNNMKKTPEGKRRTRGWALEAETRNTTFQGELISAERRVRALKPDLYTLGARKMNLEESTTIVLQL